MRKKFSKVLSAAVVIFASSTMFMADAEARRAGGGGSFGRQSSNINRAPATQAPVAPTARTNNAAAPTASSATTARNTATQPQRSGMSRFLGPIAGIAAGLGIAALLSHLGLSGAFLEFLSSAILIAIVVFGVMFILRRLRGGATRPATAGAGAYSGSHTANNTFRTSSEGQQPVVTPAVTSAPSVADTQVAQPLDSSWFIPADFNTVAFLQEAKKQFVFIQDLWDKGDVVQLRQYMTDDLVRELTPQIEAQSGRTKTEVVLLNAELLGMEKITDAGFDGHLASVRFSGMLREEVNQAAFRFEEVWNLYKADNSGWLLAGIQQIDV